MSKTTLQITARYISYTKGASCNEIVSETNKKSLKCIYKNML